MGHVDKIDASRCERCDEVLTLETAANDLIRA